MFKKKIDEAFDAVRDPDQDPVDNDEFREKLEREMEKSDFLALILGGYRFFLPVFAVILILILVVLFLW